ncbi:hypothetical protein NC652_011958 [Populus alba x Populus x berolinensis]|nr:hypothetical protein NC652_011958 [Populus alba x Populus x berolinensis]
MRRPIQRVDLFHVTIVSSHTCPWHATVVICCHPDNFIHLQWRENKKTRREGEGEMEKVMAEAEELPKAIVCRMVKDALSRCYPDESESPHFHPLSFRHCD